MDKLELNENQKKAITHSDGSIVVIAGPGSGKTTVVTHRIKYLLENTNVDQSDILVITFAKSAVVEMKKRFLSITGLENTKVTFATFHSLFYSIIRSRYTYGLNNLLKDEEKSTVLKQIISHTNKEFFDDEDFLQNVTNEISKVKNEMIDIKFHNPMDLGRDLFTNIYNIYENWKEENGKIDFDDMLTKCYELLINDKKVLTTFRNKYKYIMIDEFQDINRVQYETIKLLAFPRSNIFVVGDDDQSIYRFRGSRPEFLLNFHEDFKNTDTVFLTTNYRSTDNIINVANKVINHNKNRFTKEIIGTNLKGDKPSLLLHNDVREESIFVGNTIKKMENKTSFGEIAVIYRTNMQAIYFINTFMDMRIPFQVRDDIPSIYESWISKDICGYFTYALDRHANKSCQRIINKPKRYVSNSNIALALKKNGSLLENLRDMKNIQSWLKTRLDEMEFYLNALKKRKPYEAIKYLRQAVGYDDYIKEYADYRKINPKSLMETLTELMEASKDFETLEQYLNHVDEVIKKSKDDKTKKSRQEFDENAVVLSTMHGVKGLEYETVFVVSVNEDIIPYEKSKTDVEIEEECRLLYVAITRAKSKLYLSLLKNKHGLAVKPSRFIDKFVKK